MHTLKHKYGDMLMNALGYTDEDLAANQNGQLGPTQRAQLTGNLNNWRLLAIVTIALAALLSVYRGDGWATPVAVWLIATPILVYIGVKARAYSLDLHADEVEMVEGLIALDIINRGKNGVAYILDIEDLSFNIRKTVFLAFKNGDPYRLYYAPHSKLLLGAEWLREV
jgi:hypothetical protein